MALKTYPDVPVFMPIVTKTFVATADTATADYHEFSMERPVNKCYCTDSRLRQLVQRMLQDLLLRLQL